VIEDNFYIFLLGKNIYLYYYLIRYHNIIILKFIKKVVTFSNKKFSKSILGFQFWTFINVHFEKTEKSLGKYPLFLTFAAL